MVIPGRIFSTGLSAHAFTMAYNAAGRSFFPYALSHSSVRISSLK